MVDLRALFLLREGIGLQGWPEGGCRGSSAARKSSDLDGCRFSPDFWADWLWCAYGSATHIFLRLVATCVYFAASVPAWLSEEFLRRDRLLAPATPLVVSTKITVPDQKKS